MSGEIVHYVVWNGERVGLTMTKLRQVAPLLARELRARRAAGRRAIAAAVRERPPIEGKKDYRVIAPARASLWARLLARMRRGKR